MRAGLASNCAFHRIPGRNRLLKISVVGQVTADRSMIAELFVLYSRLAGSYSVEEIRLMGGDVTVAFGCGKGLGLDCLILERTRKRMVELPLRRVFLAQARRPAEHRVG